MIDLMQTGKRLLDLRIQKGMSQQQIAALLNVTHQAVSKWETGVALPDMATLLALAKLYHVSMEYLLTGAPQDSAARQNNQAPADTSAPAGAEEQAQEQSRDRAQEEAEESLGAQELPRMSLNEIIGLMPFLQQETIQTLLQNALDQVEEDQLERIAPFVSSDYLAKIVSERQDSLGPRSLRALAPFLPEGVLDQMIGHWQSGKKAAAGKSAGGIAAAVAARVREALGRREQNSVAQKGENQTQACAAPLDKKLRRALREEDGEWIDEHAGELDADTLYAALCWAIENGHEEGAELLAEHADADDVQEAARRAVEQQQWDLVRLIGECLG